MRGRFAKILKLPKAFLSGSDFIQEPVLPSETPDSVSLSYCSRSSIDLRKVEIVSHKNYSSAVDAVFEAMGTMVTGMAPESVSGDAELQHLRYMAPPRKIPLRQRSLISQQTQRAA